MRGAANSIAAIVLAGGMSHRMGQENKLFIDWHGHALIDHVCREILDSAVNKIIVVGGYEVDRLRKTLENLDITVIENREYASGMASSVVAGVKQFADADIDGAMVLLGDMPRISTRHIDAIIDAFQSNNGEKIIVAANEGKRGNPVLWPARFFPQLAMLSGDKGARDILRSVNDEIEMIEIGFAAHADIDSRQDLEDQKTQYP